MPVLLPPVGQAQRDETQSDVKTNRNKNVTNRRASRSHSNDDFVTVSFKVFPSSLEDDDDDREREREREGR